MKVACASSFVVGYDHRKGVDYKEGMGMRYPYKLSAIVFALTFVVTQLLAEDTAETRAATITQMLVTLCLAGGSESILTTEGNVELRSKIKDLLTGNIGADAAAGGKFTEHVWNGIIGGISKDMTEPQSEQATEARKCMEDHGFAMMDKILSK